MFLCTVYTVHCKVYNDIYILCMVYLKRSDNILFVKREFWNSGNNF